MPGRVFASLPKPRRAKALHCTGLQMANSLNSAAGSLPKTSLLTTHHACAVASHFTHPAAQGGARRGELAPSGASSRAGDDRAQGPAVDICCTGSVRRWGLARVHEDHAITLQWMWAAQAVSVAGSSPEFLMTTFLAGVPLGEPSFSTLYTTSRPSSTAARAHVTFTHVGPWLRSKRPLTAC